MLKENNKGLVAVLLTRMRNFSSFSSPKANIELLVPKMYSFLVSGSLMMEVGGRGYKAAAAAVGTQIICHLA